MGKLRCRDYNFFHVLMRNLEQENKSTSPKSSALTFILPSVGYLFLVCSVEIRFGIWKVHYKTFWNNFAVVHASNVVTGLSERSFMSDGLCFRQNVPAQDDLGRRGLQFNQENLTIIVPDNAFIVLVNFVWISMGIANMKGVLGLTGDCTERVKCSFLEGFALSSELKCMICFPIAAMTYIPSCWSAGKRWAGFNCFANLDLIQRMGKYANLMELNVHQFTMAALLQTSQCNKCFKLIF